jgi:hypothetical protein
MPDLPGSLCEQCLDAPAVAIVTAPWGTGPETGTTLYLLLAGDPEPKALPFRRTMISDCGSGVYFAQHNATVYIRRTLTKMGLLATSHAREVRSWPNAP